MSIVIRVYGYNGSEAKVRENSVICCRMDEGRGFGRGAFGAGGICTGGWRHFHNDFQVADFYFSEGATSPVLEINNVGAVRNYGGELETEMLITNYTIGSFGLSCLSSEYQDDFTLPAGRN